MNRLTAQSATIAKAVSSFSHLIENLAYQLNYIDSQLAAGLAQSGNRHAGHVRSSESARSINEIIGHVESNLNTLEADAAGGNQNPRTYQQA
jgi:DNA-binding LacI/PurR family transcriptional regulator